MKYLVPKRYDENHREKKARKLENIYENFADESDQGAPTFVDSHEVQDSDSCN